MKMIAKHGEYKIHTEQGHETVMLLMLAQDSVIPDFLKNIEKTAQVVQVGVKVKKDRCKNYNLK